MIVDVLTAIALKRRERNQKRQYVVNVQIVPTNKVMGTVFRV